MILTAAFILDFGVFIVLCICPASGDGAGQEKGQGKTGSRQNVENIFHAVNCGKTESEKWSQTGK